MEEKRFDTAAWWLHRHGVRPNHLTYAQAPFYVAMLAVAVGRDIWAFLLLQAIVIVLDGADGILARRTGTVSRRGHLLDSVFDILGIGVTLWAAAEMFPDDDLLWGRTSLHQLLFVLLLVNGLVFIQNEIQGTKAITYTRGPVTLGIVLDGVFQTQGLLPIGVALPLVVGVALLFSRVAWRKRLWNWYQFLTAGQRKTYKALTRDERSQTPEHPAQFHPQAPAARSREDEPDEAP